ncbi:MAG: hypothetical protein K8I82_31525, partial [Anaerolineae bacterium]|nr:hypothetical protein [Anaerolineae bacterium]
ANGISEYVLNAQAGQVMTVQVVSSSPLYLTILGVKDGTVFVRSDFKQALWTGELSISQDYLIQVVNPGGAANYSLNVTIPARVVFQRGATMAAVNGTLASGQTLDYVLEVNAGQTLSTAVYADNNNVFVSVAAADGTLYQSADLLQTGWTGQIPTTQDYFVRVVNRGGTTNYSVQFSVPAVIQFAPGAASAQVQGTTSACCINTYRVSARAGQTMTVTITSQNTQVGLTIVGADGTPYKRYEVGTVNTWSGVLPLTQEYMLMAIPIGQANGIHYTLDISIVN